MTNQRRSPVKTKSASHFSMNGILAKSLFKKFSSFFSFSSVRSETVEIDSLKKQVKTLQKQLDVLTNQKYTMTDKGEKLLKKFDLVGTNSHAVVATAPSIQPVVFTDTASNVEEKIKTSSRPHLPFGAMQLQNVVLKKKRKSSCAIEEEKAPGFTSKTDAVPSVSSAESSAPPPKKLCPFRPSDLKSVVLKKRQSKGTKNAIPKTGKTNSKSRKSVTGSLQSALKKALAQKFQGMGVNKEGESDEEEGDDADWLNA